MITQQQGIVFLLRSTFGGTYRRIVTAKSEDDIILACLLRAWADAFRRTMKNKANVKIKPADVLKTINAINVFREYANSRTPAAKAAILDGIKSAMKDALDTLKADNVTLGVLQKLFNMAVKYYICLFVLAKPSPNGLLRRYAFNCADCPLDEAILKSLGIHKSWSKLDDTDIYIAIQKKIRTKLQGTTCALVYDFDNWQLPSNGHATEKKAK